MKLVEIKAPEQFLKPRFLKNGYVLKFMFEAKGAWVFGIGRMFDDDYAMPGRASIDYPNNGRSSWGVWGDDLPIGAIEIEVTAEDAVNVDKFAKWVAGNIEMIKSIADEIEDRKSNAK